MTLPLPKPTMPKCPKLETNLLQTARIQAVDLDSEDSSQNHCRGDKRVLVAPFPKATFTKIEPSFRVTPKVQILNPPVKILANQRLCGRWGGRPQK
ncbi:hypothetical protein L3X38_017022 [Prunus dulcis]|uniref:Uncharacterized protein n=1 Tax=Prunus dulcis TaxID=3755 RepID=A0AAD4W717_PRUDU|nr:hypothetical protein L3X38_017022 [Prunus dulcis]